MRKTAVVILNWNGRDLLEKFLPNVIGFTPYDIAEIVVADNGSTDNSIEFVESNFPKVTIVKLAENYGFAGGYNKSLEQVDADNYILLNSDVEVSKGWLGPLVDALTTCSACMPVIKSYHNKESFEYAGASGGFIDKYGYPFCRGRIIDTLEKDNGQYSENRSVFWATGACLAIKADVYKSMNGFDSDFFAHMEEIDLCWRMKNQGHEVKVITDSTVYHVGGGTLPNESPNKLFFNFRNGLYMLYKNLPSKKFKTTLGVRMLLDGVAALKFLLSFKFKFFLTVPRAHIAFYKSIKLLKKKRAKLESERTIDTHDEIYKKSILISYFAKNQKIFADLDL